MARRKPGPEAPPFLFVNCDPTANATSKPDRASINAHSQRAFQRRRREVRAKKFRDGVSLWVPNSTKTNGQGREGSYSSSNSTTLSPNSTSILQHGNSDPFDTFSIRIDATVTSLLAFHHDCIIPSAYSLEIRNATSDVRPPGAAAAWNDAISSLLEEGTAYGLLSSLATVMAAVTKHPDGLMARRALVFRNTSSALLRYQLSLIDSKPGHIYSTSYSHLYGPILSLLAAEVASHNIHAANMHAAMLASLIRKSGGLHTVQARFRMEFLWQDIHRSVMFLQRPALDFDEWLSLPFSTSDGADGGLDLMEKVRQKSKSPALNDTIKTSSLGALFMTLRVTTEALKSSFSSEQLRLGGSGNILLWAMTEAHVCIGRVMCHFISFNQSVTTNSTTTTSSLRLVELISAYLSLAAIYWTKSCFGVAAVRIGAWLSSGGAVTHDTGLRLLPTLRYLLRCEAELQRSCPSDIIDYSEARLWALYVGSIAETQHAMRVLNAEDEAWFTRELRLQMSSMGLGSWDKLREVLETFLFSDLVQPDGSSWVFKTDETESGLEERLKVEQGRNGEEISV